MFDIDHTLNALCSRYCEIIEIFKPDYFRFPLEAAAPPFEVIDGRPYTCDGQPFNPQPNVPRQDGNARFDTEVDILKAAST
jgi:hypothetical protein